MEECDRLKGNYKTKDELTLPWSTCGLHDFCRTKLTFPTRTTGRVHAFPLPPIFHLLLASLSSVPPQYASTNHPNPPEPPPLSPSTHVRSILMAKAATRSCETGVDRAVVRRDVRLLVRRVGTGKTFRCNGVGGGCIWGQHMPYR